MYIIRQIEWSEVMYKCIILDVDGTMLNTLDVEIKCLQKVLGRRGIDASREDLEFAFGVPTEKIFEHYEIEDIEDAADEWNDCMAESISDIRFYDGVLEVLDRLKDSSITMGVVTSRTRAELERDFIPLKLFKYFEYIVCEEDTERHKPHPEPLLKFLEISGVKSEDCIYVGDTVYDLECANSAQVDFALAKWGAKDPHTIEASIVLEAPKDILSLAEI